MIMLLIAEINSFLKTLVIILLVYFALRFFIKLAWPYIVRYITKKAGQKMEQVFKGFQKQTETPASTNQEVPKKAKPVVGEYVDYEEID